MSKYVILGLVGVCLVLWWWFRPGHDVKKAREFMERMERSKTREPYRRVILNEDLRQPLIPHQMLDDGYYYRRPAENKLSSDDSCQNDLPHRASSRSSMCDYGASSGGGDSGGSSDSSGSSSSSSSSSSD